MKLMSIAAAILVLGGTGCSTGRNLMPSEVYDVPPMKVYGGVRAAVNTYHTAPYNSGVGTAAVWPLATVDLIASAFADTLTLPVTIISCLYRYYNAEDYINHNPTVIPTTEVAGTPIRTLPAKPTTLP